MVVGVWYLQAVWALSARGRTWSRMRTVSFLTGLVMIDLALQSPVASFTMGYFEAHMVQHLLLMVTAPPLLALGAPMTLALQTSSRPVKVRLLRVLNSRVFRWWSHPVPTAAVYYFAMFAFFLTSAVNVAMEHMWLMDLVNIAFLVAALHFWWPIVGVDHIPHWPMGHGAKMVALLIGVPIESFLALALLTSTRPGRFDVHGREHPRRSRDPVDRGGGLHVPGPDPGVRPVDAVRGPSHRPHRRRTGCRLRAGRNHAHRGARAPDRPDAGRRAPTVVRPGRRCR